MKLRVGISDIEIAAAHYLPIRESKCNNLHGHNWVIKELIIEGNINPETGMVIDFNLLKEIITKGDHSCLNDIMPNPTLENLVQMWIKRIEEKNVKVIHMKVFENSKCWCEYEGK